MSERRPIGLKLRFEIFKRDNFTCQYCGRRTPSVVLEIDHIKPVIENGDNDPMNLITSCFECNMGKGPRNLSEKLLGDDSLDAITALAEKERQLREYEVVKAAVRQRKDSDFAWIKRRFVLNADLQQAVRRALDGHSKYDIVDALDTAIGATDGQAKHTLRYFCGIIRNWERAGGRATDRKNHLEQQNGN